jgi:hypothetical protein
VRQWRLSTRRPSRRAGATTVGGGFAPSTIRPTLGPLYLIRTATTSKRSAMGQEKSLSAGPSIHRSAWKGNSPKFAPRFVGCDHAYTVGKMTH